jgi:hypothetical protein
MKLINKEKNDQLRLFHRWMLKQTADIEKLDEEIVKQHLQALREMQNRSALRLAWNRVIDTFELERTEVA